MRMILRWFLGRDISVIPSARWMVAGIPGMGVGLMTAQVAKASLVTAALSLPQSPGLVSYKNILARYLPFPWWSRLILHPRLLAPASHGFRKELHVPLSDRI